MSVPTDLAGFVTQRPAPGAPARFLEVGVSATVLLLELSAYHWSGPEIRRALGVPTFWLDQGLLPNLVFYVLAPVNAAVAGYVAGIAIRLIDARHDKLAAIVEASRTWLFGASVHWGPRIHASERRVANVVEGLLPVIHSQRKPVPLEAPIVREAVRFLLNGTTNAGLMSLTLGQHTVHCTAMGLYALKQVQLRQLTDVSDAEMAKADMLRRALHRSSAAFGWGFLSRRPNREDQVRLFSTLWALRALNLCGDSSANRVAEVLRKVLSRVPGQRLGFAFSDSPKLATTSLLLILLSELRSETLRAEALQTVSVRGLLEFIIDGLVSTGFSEAEEYRYLRTGVEKLSWVHMSRALGIAAASAYFDHLSTVQRLRLRSAIAKMLREHWHRDGFFFDRSTWFDASNPHIFPTAYCAVALSEYLSRSRGIRLT